MRDYLTIGSSPVGESCAQVGEDNYNAKATRECRIFKNQLIRMFGAPPEGTDIRTKSFPHDFGSYKEVCVFYDDNDEKGIEYAYKLEAESPEFWDDEAKIELALAEGLGQ